MHNPIKKGFKKKNHIHVLSFDQILKSRSRQEIFNIPSYMFYYYYYYYNIKNFSACI